VIEPSARVNNNTPRACIGGGRATETQLVRVVHAGAAIAFVASMLLLATVWLGSAPVDHPPIAEQILPVVRELDYDVISSFSPLSDLSQAPADEDTNDSDTPQKM